MKHFLLLAAASVSCSTIAVAQTERDLDSHAHGLASLNVALADSSVFIELSTPWNNVVGFEHAPQTDEQHAQVDAALATLNDPTQMFAFNAGNCTVAEVDVDNSMSADSHDDHDEHADDHDDDHKEAHGDDHDEHKDEHSDEHGHDDHAEEASSHSALLVMYTYECESIDQLSTIDLTLFSIWSGFEDLDVQLIGDKGQALAELNPGNTVLSLESVK